MTEDTVLIERHGARANLILNRPGKRNALTGPMMAALRDAVNQLASDDSVHAILLHGAGGAFCSGLDLNAMNAEPRPDWVDQMPRIWREANIALARCPKPMVGALEKYAINGGAPPAFACDYLVMGESAYLQVGEVQRGMAAPINLVWLQAKYGEAVSLRLALIGEPVGAAELLRLGLASQVVADGDVLAKATEWADKLAAYPPTAAQNIKRSIRALGFSDPETLFARAQTGAAPIA